MSRFYKKRIQTQGQAPGTVVFIGQQKMDHPELTLFVYNEGHFEESRPDVPPEASRICGNGDVLWLNVDGLHDTEFLKKLGDANGIHPLIQEDIANTGQRAKFEEIDRHLFITLKTMELGPDSKVKSEQLGIVFDNHHIFTFKESGSDIFDFLYDRIRRKTGRMRLAKSDYAAFAILDAVVDDYLFLLEELGQKIENLEISLLNEPASWMVASINHYKRELNYLSKTIRPVREMVLDFYRSDSDFINDATRPFIRDLLDLVTHAIEVIDSYRDMLSDYLHIYNARQNNQLTDIMRVLTVFSTVFIPLTFLAGVYGTNFKHMPEYNWQNGHLYFWGACLLIALSVLGFIRYRKWI
jgi:magnesium transporter